MGRSIYETPRNVRDYQSAKYIHDQIVPLRGRSPEIRPLGARRHVDSYSVRMNGDNVEFVLYQTPVLTYRPDNTVAVFMNGHDTISTRTFISWILQVGVGSKRGHVVMSYGGAECILPTDRELVFRVEGGRLALAHEPEKYYGYRMKRKVANSVRARLKPFYDYMRGFVALRTIEHVTKTSWFTRTDKCVTISHTEAVQVLGVRKLPLQTGMYTLGSESWNLSGTSAGRDEIKKVFRMFADLVSTPQDNPQQTENFYKALLGMLMVDHHVWLTEDGKVANPEASVAFISTAIELLMDNYIMRAHASEVLERVELKQGATPNPKYTGWI